MPSKLQEAARSNSRWEIVIDFTFWTTQMQYRLTTICSTESSTACESTQSVIRVSITIWYTSSKLSSFIFYICFNRLPQNLRPHTYNRHVPQYQNKNFNSSRFIWKLLNRTIYNPKSDHWLRRNMNSRDLDITEVKMLNIFKYKYGLKHVHTEERFYDLFKISRADFLDKLSKINDPEKVE